MVAILNISGSNFTIDGISYKKVFVALPVGLSKIKIVGAYDSKFQLLEPTPYDEISVNGLTFGGPDALIAYLVNVIFIRGEAGPAGNDGLGVPAGGTALQVLQKISSADNDTQWATIRGIPSGGTTGQFLRKTSGTDYAVSWQDYEATGINYRGTWDAATGAEPDNGVAAASTGDFWIVDNPGATDLNGINTWQDRDWAIWNGTVWERVPGAVVLIYVGVDSNDDNLSASASTAKYIWDALQTYITSSGNAIGQLITDLTAAEQRIQDLEDAEAPEKHIQIDGNLFELRKMPGNNDSIPEEGDIALNGWISQTEFGKILVFKGGDPNDFADWDVHESI